MRTFQITTSDQRDRLLAFLKAREIPFQVDFGPIREQRTSSQNSRIWALHTLASRETGYSPEEMHEFALMRHFGSREIEVGGMKRSVPLKRSSTREKKEFAEFMEATEAWYASEFGVWLGQDD